MKTDLEQRTGMLYKVFLQSCIDRLEKRDGLPILLGVGQLLTEKQKVWAKVKLIPETIFQLRLALSNKEA